MPKHYPFDHLFLNLLEPTQVASIRRNLRDHPKVCRWEHYVQANHHHPDKALVALYVTIDWLATRDVIEIESR